MTSEKPTKEGIRGFRASAEPLKPWEREIVATAARTMTVIADLLAGLPLERVISDIEYLAAQAGNSTRPFAHSVANNRLFNVQKLAMALLEAQRVVNHDVRCVCGHGFRYHATPGTECVAVVFADVQAEHARKAGARDCDCDEFQIQAAEFAPERNDNG